MPECRIRNLLSLSVSELQKTETKTGRDELVKKYMSEFSQGEIEFSLEDPNDSVLSDEMMDEIIGGQEGSGCPVDPMLSYMGKMVVKVPKGTNSKNQL